MDFEKELQEKLNKLKEKQSKEIEELAVKFEQGNIAYETGKDSLGKGSKEFDKFQKELDKKEIHPYLVLSRLYREFGKENKGKFKEKLSEIDKEKYGSPENIEIKKKQRQVYQTYPIRLKLSAKNTGFSQERG